MAALISKYWAIIGVARAASSLREAFGVAAPSREPPAALIPVSAMAQGVASRASPHKGMATNRWGKDFSASAACFSLSMILSENRFTLFRIML